MPTHHHSHALKEAIIAHWQNGLPYSQIVKKINGSGIAKISKSSVWYQINKFKQTDSTNNKQRSEKHVKGHTKIWTGSSVALSKLGMTLILTWYVHVALTRTRDLRP